MFWDTQAAKVGGGMGCEPNCVSHLCLLPPSAWGGGGGCNCYRWGNGWEELARTQGPALSGQKDRPHPETSGALSRARRSPFHPTRTASAVTHGRCLLALWCAPRHRHLLAQRWALGAHFCLSHCGLLVFTVTWPCFWPDTVLLPSRSLLAPIHPPWPGSGPKSGVAHGPNLGKELRPWGCGEAGGRGAHGKQGGAALSKDGHTGKKPGVWVGGPPKQNRGGWGCTTARKDGGRS